MRIIPTTIPGMRMIEAEPHRDERGGFARLYCPEAFAAAGIAFTSTQVNLSRNDRKHTLRGMHYQKGDKSEAKLVRCVSGRVWDVAVDLREGDGFGRHVAVALDAERMNAVFIPEGVAHGFLTLSDRADVLYQMGRIYEPGHEAGIRWNDPAFGLRWPAEPAMISDRDASWHDWNGEKEPAPI